MDAWVSILVAVSGVMRTLESEMAEKHDLPITWFDVLNRLDQAPDHRLRMHELEDMIHLHSERNDSSRRSPGSCRSRTTRADTGDRRGVYLAITDTGAAKLAEVWPDHLKGIEEHFARHISTSDATTIRSVAAKVTGSRPSLGHRPAPSVP